MTIPGWAGRLGGALLIALALLSFAGRATAFPITLVDNRTAGFVGMAQQGPFDTPLTVYSWLEYEQYFGGSTVGLANPYLYASVVAYFENGGYALTIVRVADDSDATLIGSDGGAGARTGMQALRDADVSVIAIPGATTQPVQAAAIALCESMGDRLAILDPAAPTSVSAVTAQRAALSTADGFGVLYFPWVQTAIPGAPSPMPPSGFAAGRIAETAPPATPAGTVSTATGVSTPIGEAQSSDLTALGIDPIREFVGQGVRFFGARTLATYAEYRYIPTRRRAFAISASLRAGTAWCLDQPNDETTWAQIASDAIDFLHMLWLGGWFQGASPSQAYFVHCDASTMTQDDIDAGRTVLLVGFAPLTPGEFILLRIEQTRPPLAGVAPATARFAMAAPRPNPFRPGTTIAFELPQSSALTLSVHDVSGRLVRMLAAGAVFSAGHHDITWDGRDDAGGEAAPGVYMVRMQAGERVMTSRVTRLR